MPAYSSPYLTMVSTSTPYPQAAASVVLPSIHEMFPEHIMSRAAAPARPRVAPATPLSASAFPRSHFVPPPPPPPPIPYPSFSFDFLKSDPRGSSLEHIASSQPQLQAPARRYRPAVQTQPREYNLHSHSQSQYVDFGFTRRAQSASAPSDWDVEIDMEVGVGGAEEEKKHVCPTCAKRFNRPSSLRIHINTHTGATRESFSLFFPSDVSVFHPVPLF